MESSLLLLQQQVIEQPLDEYILISFHVDTWLITGGRNFGVIKEVGKALNKYRYKTRKQGLNVPCLGVCTWEYTAGTDQLDNTPIDSTLTNDTEGTFPRLRFRRTSRMESALLMVRENFPRTIDVILCLGCQQ